MKIPNQKKVRRQKERAMSDHTTQHQSEVPNDSSQDDPAESYQERLSALLDSLPRETAPDDFTDRVLRRLPANDTTPVYARPWVLAVAAMLLLTVAIGFREWRHQVRQDEAIERIAEMRAEYEILQQELDALKTRATENRVVYLGEANGTEVVLDLARLPDNKSRLEALRLLQAGLLRASSRSPAPSDPGTAQGEVRTADYRPEASGPVYY